MESKDSRSGFQNRGVPGITALKTLSVRKSVEKGEFKIQFAHDNTSFHAIISFAPCGVGGRMLASPGLPTPVVKKVYVWYNVRKIKL